MTVRRQDNNFEKGAQKIMLDTVFTLTIPSLCQQQKIEYI